MTNFRTAKYSSEGTGIDDPNKLVELSQAEIAQVQALVSGAWNAGQQAVVAAGGGIVVADLSGNMTGPGGAIASGGGGGGGSAVLSVTASAFTSMNAANSNCLNITLDASVSLAFVGIPSGLWQLRIFAKQDAVGGRVVTWPPNTNWLDQTPPTQSTNPNATDLYDLFTIDQGATWYGVQRYRGGTSPILLSDTVSRADSAVSPGTADTGQAWGALTATWGVISNRLYRVGVSATDSILSVDVGAAWSVYSVLVKHSPEFPGVAFDITDANNCYVLLLTDNVSSANLTVQLYRRASGSYTLIGTAANGLFVNGADVPVEIRRNATSRTITVKIGGATVLTVTDSGLSVSTKVGARLQTALGTNAARWSAIGVS